MPKWMIQSFVAMILLVPAWMAIRFFDRNYHVNTDTYLVWYLLGIVGLVVICGKSPTRTLLPSLGVIGVIGTVIYIFSTLCGGFANILIFDAVARASADGSNASVAIAILNITSIGIYLASLLLARLLPNYFDATTFNPWTFLGIVLVGLGASLVAINQQ